MSTIARRQTPIVAIQCIVVVQCIVAALAVAMTLAACGGGATGAGGSSDRVRLGLFPNVTHAPALVGLAEGTFAAALGPDVELQTFAFDSGTNATEAFLAGSLDLTFVGANPAINAFAQSGGEAVRIVAGSTSGGAFLVVRPDITSVDQLRGTRLATPSLGNTQDVALRSWLRDHELETTVEGGGDVTIVPQKNSTTLESFLNGDIDGAWVPEPWATRLVDEGHGRVLVDERDLWPETGGRYITTQLIVRTEFLERHPDLVQAVIEGLADAIDFIAASPAAAQADVVEQIASITGSAPKPETIARAFTNLTFTLDPIVPALYRSARAAASVGLLGDIDLGGIHDLTLLNHVLAARGLPAIDETEAS